MNEQMNTGARDRSVPGVVMASLVLGLMVNGVMSASAVAQAGDPPATTRAADSAPEPQKATRPLPDQTTPEIKALRDRAEQYWGARHAEDWAKVYTFRTPEEQAKATVEQFTEWSSTQEPFIVESYSVGPAQIERHMGWVQMTSGVSMRRFEGSPVRSATRWELWEQVDKVWYPVTPDRLGEFPRVPSERDLEAEKVATKQFMASWEARKAADWEALYFMTSPTFREFVAEGDFASSLDLAIFVDVKLNWVEVVGDTARMYVQYSVKPNDPSMTKLQPHWAHLIEVWTRVDGRWYWDVPVNPVADAEGEEPSAAPKGGSTADANKPPRPPMIRGGG